QGTYPLATAAGRAVRAGAYWLKGMGGGTGAELLRAPAGGLPAFTQPYSGGAGYVHQLCEADQSRLVAVYPGPTNTCVKVSDNYGDSWRSIASALPAPVVAPMVASGVDAGGEPLLVITASDGEAYRIFYSEDNGETWQRATDPLSPVSGSNFAAVHYAK